MSTTPTLPYCCFSDLSRSHEYDAVLTCIADSSKNAPVLESIASASRDILLDSCGSTASIKDGLEKLLVGTSESTNRNGQQNQEATYRTSSQTLQAVERNGGECRQTTERTSAELRNIVANCCSDLKTGQKENLKEILLRSCETDSKLLQGFGETRLDLCKVENKLERQAADNSATIRLELCKTADELAREALKNKAELSAQMEMCCCDLKQKIDARANETNQLIRQLETDRIRDELAAAQQENLILRLGGGVIPPISAR